MLVENVEDWAEIWLCFCFYSEALRKGRSCFHSEAPCQRHRRRYSPGFSFRGPASDSDEGFCFHSKAPRFPSKALRKGLDARYRGPEGPVGRLVSACGIGLQLAAPFGRARLSPLLRLGSTSLGPPSVVLTRLTPGPSGRWEGFALLPPLRGGGPSGQLGGSAPSNPRPAGLNGASPLSYNGARRAPQDRKSVV